MNDNMKPLGMLIVVAVLLIVGVIIFQVAAQNVGESTNTVSMVNETYTAGANGESFYITDYRALSDVVVHNESGGEVIAEGNYTVTNNVVYNGNLAVKFTVDDAEYESMDWNVSATAQPLTYVADSGGRAVVSLIPIMLALLLVVVAMYPVIKDKLAGLMGN